MFSRFEIGFIGVRRSGGGGGGGVVGGFCEVGENGVAGDGFGGFGCGGILL
ncbi:unannotated protein [freshwater metagenome]|uniref:Unannotated protein n=1 Tax=freshwater metagenome TaxID=449393 RepID=A0A6J6F341_9ZZZZ